MTAATPQDVQAKIDAGLKDMVAAAALVPYVKSHGTDPSKWPTSTSIGAAAANFLAARAEAGELVAPAPPTAGFTAKEG
jgi:hypothetical protein